VLGSESACELWISEAHDTRNLRKGIAQFLNQNMKQSRGCVGAMSQSNILFLSWWYRDGVSAYLV